MCPQEAIRLTEDGVEILESCSNCNICSNFCPTLSLFSPNFEEQLYFDLKNTKSRFISCYEAKPLGIHIPCIASLNALHLLNIIAFLKEKIFLLVGNCEKCPNGKAMSLFTEKIYKLGLNEEKLVIISEGVEEERIDRLKFFSIIKKGITLQVIKKMNLKKEKTFSRSEISKTLKAAEIEPKNVMWFYSPSIERSCDFCFLCVNLCPFKALSIEEQNDGERILYLNPDSCNSCKVCKEVCPKDAISMKYDFDVEKKVLKKSNKPFCKICKREVSEAETLCDYCNKSRNGKFQYPHFVHFERNKMWGKFVK